MDTLDPDDVQACISVLRTIDADRATLTQLSQAQRRELLTLAGLIAKPERHDLVKMAKAFRRAQRAAARERDRQLIQQTGLLDSINAIRGVAVEYALPICMMVGLLEKEPGVPPLQSKRYGVRIVEPILDAMGIPYHEIETDDDLGKIKPAIDEAYAASRPMVLLIGRRPA